MLYTMPECLMRWICSEKRRAANQGISSRTDCSQDAHLESHAGAAKKPSFSELCRAYTRDFKAAAANFSRIRNSGAGLIVT